jgi:aconitate hydratase
MNSFGTRTGLTVGGRTCEIHRLPALGERGMDVSRLPYSLRILLENLLRREDGVIVTRDDIESLARWQPGARSEREIAFAPARVLLQDFTGVPAVVDLAAMRDAMAALGGDPRRINPLQPVELVVDHSVQVDAFGTREAFALNEELDYGRNRERYAFLRWGQRAFDNFRVVPPNTGIVHQVNLEYLARVVFTSDENPGASGVVQAYPDTVVGTDSHTPMVNGLGVLGWGVGGIEAEAAMLGQPVSMLVPEVIGFRLSGELREGTTATDLVLTVTELLRKKGVVGKFVEFYGPGLSNLPLADRATIGNMSPEYGATCAIFPVDQVTLNYLRFTGRPPERVALVEAYMKEQGLFHTASSPEPEFTDTVELDLGSVEPSIAGPRRPQDRVRLEDVKGSFAAALPSLMPARTQAQTAKDATAGRATRPGVEGVWGEGSKQSPAAAPAAEAEIDHGSIVIAAITSCTNTSNPAVMLAAGLVAKKAVERGLDRKPWVKTSLAPGSKVVTRYYEKSGLGAYLDQLGFQTVGYGCTTCIGNSGPLPENISEQIQQRNLVAVSVLSGNRNFEGRINSDVRANYLMSPPLVVAYALAGRIDVDLVNEPLAEDRLGKPVYLRDIWPTRAEVDQVMQDAVRSEMFRETYAEVFAGDERWNSMPVPEGDHFAWEPTSTYVRQPTYFDGMPEHPPSHVSEVAGARALLMLGDSITTDHISPAGSIRRKSPAGDYLVEHGVDPKEFNSYGSRRGNHEVMVRGTFANVRIRNQLAPGTEGGYTTYFPTGEVLSVFDAAERYAKDATPLIVLAGKEYGSGSSRDWAAKGPYLQGVRAVIAESYERIHRSNLVGMGILPLQFAAGESAVSLGLTGQEIFDIAGAAAAIEGGFREGRTVRVTARSGKGQEIVFHAMIRIDTPQEVLYYRHGGILQYVLRQLLHGRDKADAISGGVAVGQPNRPSNDRKVTESSVESFPASDPPAY